MYVYARLKYYQTFSSIIRNILTDQKYVQCVIILV